MRRVALRRGVCWHGDNTRLTVLFLCIHTTRGAIEAETDKSRSVKAFEVGLVVVSVVAGLGRRARSATSQSLHLSFLPFNGATTAEASLLHVATPSQLLLLLFLLLICTYISRVLHPRSSSPSPTQEPSPFPRRYLNLATRRVYLIRAIDYI
ncbi:hypothetical protein E2C01_090527 [Portunus trituberculatus]|uniref:Uncharacterized protein n=1 Tax=Portunus trituberculatus TaxID=210409 RepID=A0A5B7JEX9_PORTR|nr:hypothetical protein [Portunus trituberculatus]